MLKLFIQYIHIVIIICMVHKVTTSQKIPLITINIWLNHHSLISFCQLNFYFLNEPMLTEHYSLYLKKIQIHIQILQSAKYFHCFHHDFIDNMGKYICVYLNSEEFHKYIYVKVLKWVKSRL